MGIIGNATSFRPIQDICVYRHPFRNEQKSKLSERLMQPDMFSGGASHSCPPMRSRTIRSAITTARSGRTINAIIADGLGTAKAQRSGQSKVLNAMFRVAKSEPDPASPELFCGFASDYAEQPILVPGFLFSASMGRRQCLHDGCKVRLAFNSCSRPKCEPDTTTAARRALSKMECADCMSAISEPISF